MTPDMMDSWMDVGTGGMYTVMDDDAGYYLRAAAMYTDAQGPNKMAYEKTEGMVGADVMMPGDALLDMYDADDSGLIERSEAVKAVLDYLIPGRPDQITRAQAIEVVTAYILETAVPKLDGSAG